MQVGGLGDVVHGLARTSLARGHNVSVLMPFYECLPQDQIEGLGFEMEVDVPKGYTWDGVMQVCVCDVCWCWWFFGGGEGGRWRGEVDVPKGCTWDKVMQVWGGVQQEGRYVCPLLHR